jgi:hypothetical protein
VENILTEDEYYEWFKACGFDRLGTGTEITEDLINARGTVIQVPRASVLSPKDRREAAEGMSRYFGWKSAWGTH